MYSVAVENAACMLIILRMHIDDRWIQLIFRKYLDVFGKFAWFCMHTQYASNTGLYLQGWHRPSSTARQMATSPRMARSPGCSQNALEVKERHEETWLITAHWRYTLRHIPLQYIPLRYIPLHHYASIHVLPLWRGCQPCFWHLSQQNLSRTGAQTKLFCLERWSPRTNL